VDEEDEEELTELELDEELIELDEELEELLDELLRELELELMELELEDVETRSNPKGGSYFISLDRREIIASLVSSYNPAIGYKSPVKPLNASPIPADGTPPPCQAFSIENQIFPPLTAIPTVSPYEYALP